MSGAAADVGMLFVLFYVALFGLGLYVLILLMKLAHRGIRALDLYIAEKQGGGKRM